MEKIINQCTITFYTSRNNGSKGKPNISSKSWSWNHLSRARALRRDFRASCLNNQGRRCPYPPCPEIVWKVWSHMIHICLTLINLRFTNQAMHHIRQEALLSLKKTQCRCLEDYRATFDSLRARRRRNICTLIKQNYLNPKARDKL